MNKSKKKSNVLIIIGIVLVCALAIGLVATVSGGFKNWNTKTWFDKTKEPVKEPVEEIQAPIVNTYKIDMSFRLTDDEPYWALLDFKEAFDISKTEELDVTFNEKDLKLKRFCLISEGMLVTGWTDSGNTECEVAILGFYDWTGTFDETGNPVCKVMTMTKGELTIRTPYKVTVILSGAELKDHINDKDDKENIENTEVSNDEE